MAISARIGRPLNVEAIELKVSAEKSPSASYLVLLISVFRYHISFDALILIYFNRVIHLIRCKSTMVGQAKSGMARFRKFGFRQELEKDVFRGMTDFQGDKYDHGGRSSRYC